MKDTFLVKCTHCGAEENLADIIFRCLRIGAIKVDYNLNNDIVKIHCRNCGNWEQEDMSMFVE